MSTHAHRIEHARRIYAAALGTAAEESARRNLELVIADARPEARTPPDWCCGARCRHCEAWEGCK